ncbi:protein belonging to Uncharacterized protein family UPF0153 [Candidatus Magnetomorum sp. HK-1]|nr:protein belonging to Uncharacterized protein family UPF0153 [Candidatus Magnetomorum sp. HK-1]
MNNLNFTDKSQNQCRRCGTCCQKNSPALHLADLELIKSGKIGRNHLITYRKGEWVNDNVAGTFIRLEQDLIKLVEKSDTSCSFYQNKDQSCGIYDSRLEECKIQQCYDPEPFKKFYTKDRLTRSDIYPENSAFYELIKYHEKECPLDNLKYCDPHSKKTLPESIKHDFRESIRFEYHYRYTLFQRTGLQSTEMNFLLGRPLEMILKQMQVTI